MIENCFDGIEDASILPIFDLEYLFLKLRSKSVQEVVTPILECPITREKIKLKIQLDEIKVKTFENHNKIIKIINCQKCQKKQKIHIHIQYQMMYMKSSR